MSSRFDESQLTDLPSAFDESQLTDLPAPAPDLPYQAINDALDVTSKMLDFWREGVPRTSEIAAKRRLTDMGESQIGRTEGPHWATETMIPKQGALPLSEAKRQPEGINLPEGGPVSKAAAGFTEGLANTVEGVAEFATSPGGAAITVLSGGAGSLAPIAQALVKGTFAVDIASSAPQLYKRLVSAAEHYGETNDPQELSQALTEAAAAGYFVGEMGRGAVKGAVEQFRGKPAAASPVVDETLGTEGPPTVEGRPPATEADRDRVTFTPVMTPEQRAAEIAQRKSFAQELARQAEQRKAEAEDYLRRNLGDNVEIPAPPTAEQLQRFIPTDDEVAEVRRKSMYRDGAVAVDEIPETLATKIRAEARIDGLLEAMEQTREAGGVGKWTHIDPTENASFDSPWRTISSPLPKELQQKFSWDDIFRIVERGRMGEPLTPRQMRFYEDVVTWASKSGKLDPYVTQEYLDKYGFEVMTLPIKEQVDQQATGALERAAVEAEAKGATGDLSAADLEFRAPTGTSDVETVGIEGEPIRPLNPPELDLRGALDGVLARATKGDPQRAADLLTAVYGIPDRVRVRTDPTATVPRTEELPIAGIERARTGQPITMKLYRGEGAESTPLTRGMGVPLLGPGRYTTADPMYAKEYGQVRDVLVDLKNPLVIRNDQDWRALTQKAGWEFPNVAGQDPAAVAALTTQIRGVVEQMGHDGMVIDFDPMNEQVAKTLGRMFDHSTVIEFQPQDVARFTVTLPPGASLWQVAHEVGYEVRKFAGKLNEELPHDDNIIAARTLSDLRARGFIDDHGNGVPKTGFVGGSRTRSGRRRAGRSSSTNRFPKRRRARRMCRSSKTSSIRPGCSIPTTSSSTAGSTSSSSSRRRRASRPASRPTICGSSTRCGSGIAASTGISGRTKWAGT